MTGPSSSERIHFAKSKSFIKTMSESNISKVMIILELADIQKSLLLADPGMPQDLTKTSKHDCIQR